MDIKKIIKDYSLITFSTCLIMMGVYFFKFPNNFTFGGITGLSVVLGKVTPISPSTVNLILNFILLILGFLFLGRSFAIKTVYSSILLSVGLSVLDHVYPIKHPLTDQPMLELVFAVALPALGSAILFNIGASSGGTDIIALIMKKYTSADIGRAVFYSDVLITFSACFVFDIKTVLFSFLGLLTKSLVIDNVIESINLAKYFSVICSEPEIICNFIVNNLNRGATICEAKGAYSHKHKYIVFTALRRPQAVQLRQFIKQVEPDAFILITNTSEIIGKGFHD
ncbi:MAG TPA: YitT family protein [Caproiciproducens sp.]|nr:YitT family protein [Caproiciproducens sp.]